MNGRIYISRHVGQVLRSSGKGINARRVRRYKKRRGEHVTQMLQVKDIGGKGRVGEVCGTRRIESTRLQPQIAESAQYQPIAFTYCPRSTALRLYHQSFTVRQNLSPEKGLQNCYSIVIITIAIAYSPYRARVHSPSHSIPQPTLLRELRKVVIHST